MEILAKVYCHEVTKRLHWQKKNADGSFKFLFTAKMSPVTNGSKENEEFFEATPSGSIELGTVKEDLFQVGKEYLVTFKEV